MCGGPGAGKSLLALQFLVSGATELGEPGVFVSFEETELDGHPRIVAVLRSAHDLVVADHDAKPAEQLDPDAAALRFRGHSLTTPGSTDMR